MASTLTDPNGLLKDNPELLKKLQKKIEDSMTSLYMLPASGGNPFLFCFAVSKPHILCNKLTSRGHDIDLDTAATNGKLFVWNPEFLEALLTTELHTVMCHEVWHVVFNHCKRLVVLDNGKRANKGVVGAIVDLFTNGIIEKEHETSGRSKKYKLWGQGALGTPISLAMWLKWIDGDDTALPPPGTKVAWTDQTILDRLEEDVYTEVMDHKDKSPRKCKKCHALSLDPKTGVSRIKKPWGPECCPQCGAKPSNDCDGDGFGSMDGHIESDLSEQETMTEVAKAANQLKGSMPGAIPQSIQTMLEKLEKPTLQPHQVIKNALVHKVLNDGNKNDYKRFRRRLLQNEIYKPKTFTHKPRWLAMLDTSGSMSDPQIAKVVKELKLVATGEGMVVPVDAAPHWESAVSVKNIDDLKRIKVVGRGGTVFEEFFRDYKNRVGGNWDIVIVLTDGDITAVPLEYRPPCDCLWIITDEHASFKPPFGRVVFLK